MSMWKRRGLPEHEHPEHSIGRRMHVLRHVAPRADHDGRHQRRSSPYQVHRAAPGNVHDPQLLQESVLVPDPARGQAVHERIQERVHAVRWEVEPFRDGPRDDGRGCRRERQLEDVGGVQVAHVRVIGVDEVLAHCEEGVAAFVVSVAHAVTEHPVAKASKDHVDDVLHHHVHFVFSTHTARFEKGETWKGKGSYPFVLKEIWNSELKELKKKHESIGVEHQNRIQNGVTFAIWRIGITVCVESDSKVMY